VSYDYVTQQHTICGQNVIALIIHKHYCWYHGSGTWWTYS